MPSNRRLSALLAAALWSSVLALAIMGPSRASLVPSLAAYTAAFAALLGLWRNDPGFLDDPRILLGGALVLRLTLFPSLPDLSDDLYRYVWDGWLTASGINPFRFIPSDPELARFQDSDLFPALNSPDYHSIYPPVSQLVFLVGGAIYRVAGWPAAAYGVKAAFLVLEVTGVGLLYLAVRALGLAPRVLALYALNPLVLVTLSGGGHSESGLVLGFGMMALGVARERATLSWVGVVIAAGTKGIPLLVAPLLAKRQWGTLGPRRTTLAALPALILGSLLVLPFYFSGLPTAVGSSIDLYVRLFEFNAGPYFLVRETALVATGIDWGRALGPIFRAAFLAGAAVVWLRWPVRTPEGFFRGVLILIGLYLATATTVHPWYLTWGLVLVPFTTAFRGAWLWASWSAFLTYFAYLGAPQGPLATVVWGGVGVFLLVEAEGSIRTHLLRWAGRRKARQIEDELRGDLVLDLGAGEGYVASHLTRGRRVILVDVGAFFKVPLPGAVYDGHRLPLRDDSVDTVLLSLSLHHARDPERVVREALRVARERVVVTESTYRWEWERRLLRTADRWANRMRGMSEGKRDPAEPSFRPVAAWEAAIEEAGGRVLRSGRLNRIGHRHHLIIAVPSG